MLAFFNFKNVRGSLKIFFENYEIYFSSKVLVLIKYIYEIKLAYLNNTHKFSRTIIICIFYTRKSVNQYIDFAINSKKIMN